MIVIRVSLKSELSFDQSIGELTLNLRWSAKKLLAVIVKYRDS